MLIIKNKRYCQFKKKKTIDIIIIYSVSFLIIRKNGTNLCNYLCDGIYDHSNGQGLNVTEIDSICAPADEFECFLPGISFIAVIIIISITYYALTTQVPSPQPNQESKKLKRDSHGPLPGTATITQTRIPPEGDLIFLRNNGGSEPAFANTIKNKNASQSNTKTTETDDNLDIFKCQSYMQCKCLKQ